MKLGEKVYEKVAEEVKQGFTSGDVGDLFWTIDRGEANQEELDSIANTIKKGVESGNCSSGYWYISIS